MDCPNCNKSIPADRTFCAWCKAFVPEPQMGKKAGLFTRWLANLVDYVPLAIVTLLWIAEVTRQSTPGDGFEASPVVVVGVGIALLSYLVFLFWLWSDGVSPVKRLLGLEVVSEVDGNYLGFGKMVQREIIGKALSGLPLGLGFLWAIWDQDGQTWHDKLAGTVVVQRPRRQPAPAPDERQAFAAPLTTHSTVPLIYHCPSCRQVLRQRVRFCPHCKRPLKFALQRQHPTPVPSPPRVQPPSVDQLLEKGIAQVQRGDIAGGRATLRRVVVRSPDNATAWLWMGWVAVGQRDYHIAEICFSQAQRLGHPKSAQVLEALRERRLEGLPVLTSPR